MIELAGLAHFSIPVRDLERSIQFYTTVVGCKLINKLPPLRLAFLDAAGACVILVERKDMPVATPKDGDHLGVHHAFVVAPDNYQAALDHLRTNNISIFFEEDRQGGVVNGPRAYFRDPDGTVLEFVNLTSYDTTPR